MVTLGPGLWTFHGVKCIAGCRIPWREVFPTYFHGLQHYRTFTSHHSFRLRWLFCRQNASTLRSGPTFSQSSQLVTVSGRFGLFSGQLKTVNRVDSWLGSRRWLRMASRRCESTQRSSTNAPPDLEDLKKLPLIQRFKQMWKKYWYVVIPVHVITYAMWFGGFYFLSVSGLDALVLLEKIVDFFGFDHASVDKVRSYSPFWRHLAIAYLLCKVISIVRYAVTVTATHFAIKLLSRHGWIKPVPSRTRLKEMYKDRHDHYEKMREQVEGRYQKWRERPRTR